MNSKIVDTLESLEDRIESIKWLIRTYYSKVSGGSETINTIRRSAGILGKESIKGTVFENRVRREWNANFLKRIG